jgi:hypothetical protein
MSQDELLKSSYPYRLGCLMANCRFAIIQLEVFLESRKNELSKSDYIYLEDVAKGLRKSLNEAND